MKIWISALVVVCVAWFVYAEEHDDHDDREREHAEHYEEFDEYDDHYEVEPLGKTVRLTFIAEPDDDDEKLSVVTATTEYGLMVEMQGEGEGFQFGIEGEAILLDDDRLGLTFELEMAMETEEGEVAYAARGSSVAKIGGKAELGTFGDQTLFVQIEEIK